MFYVVLKSCSTVKYVILRKEVALNSQVLHRHNASFVGLAWLLPLVSPGWSLVSLQRKVLLRPVPLPGPLVAAGMTGLSSPRAPASRSSNAGDPAVDRRLPLRLLDSSARPRTQPRVTGCCSGSSIPQRRNQL